MIRSISAGAATGAAADAEAAVLCLARSSSSAIRCAMMSCWARSCRFLSTSPAYTLELTLEPDE